MAKYFYKNNLAIWSHWQSVATDEKIDGFWVTGSQILTKWFPKRTTQDTKGEKRTKKRESRVR